MLIAFILWLFTIFALFSSVVYVILEGDDPPVGVLGVLGCGAKPRGEGPLRRFWESAGEHRCRKWLVSRFRMPFPNVRPYWLINPETFHRLELDCYNADLQIAAEYQGRQHYDGDPSIARRDEYKVKQCIDRGVALVVVPYWVHVEDFLEREFACLESGDSAEGTPLIPRRTTP